MKKNLIFISIWVFGIQTHFGQSPKPLTVTWKVLSKINEVRDYSPLRNRWITKTVFSDDINLLDGKLIRIEGYIIPSDITGKTCIISSQPFNSCFFCGGAGKETVMELKLQRQYWFTTDDVKMFQGKLKIQRLPDQLYYLLEEAELSDEKSTIFFED